MLILTTITHRTIDYIRRTALRITSIPRRSRAHRDRRGGITRRGRPRRVRATTTNLLFQSAISGTTRESSSKGGAVVVVGICQCRIARFTNLFDRVWNRRAEAIVVVRRRRRRRRRREQRRRGGKFAHQRGRGASGGGGGDGAESKAGLGGG